MWVANATRIYSLQSETLMYFRLFAWTLAECLIEFAIFGKHFHSRIDQYYLFSDIRLISNDFWNFFDVVVSRLDSSHENATFHKFDLEEEHECARKFYSLPIWTNKTPFNWLNRQLNESEIQNGTENGFHRSTDCKKKSSWKNKINFQVASFQVLRICFLRYRLHSTQTK